MTKLTTKILAEVIESAVEDMESISSVSTPEISETAIVEPTEESTEPKTIEIGERSDEELKKIAMAIHDGLIFTSRHLKEYDNPMMVFFPLIGFAGYPEEEIKKIGMVFEYYEKAGPRGVNGLPFFHSFEILGIEQVDKMNEYYKKYKALKDAF